MRRHILLADAYEATHFPSNRCSLRLHTVSPSLQVPLLAIQRKSQIGSTFNTRCSSGSSMVPSQSCLRVQTNHAFQKIRRARRTGFDVETLGGGLCNLSTRGSMRASHRQRRRDPEPRQGLLLPMVLVCGRKTFCRILEESSGLWVTP